MTEALREYLPSDAPAPSTGARKYRGQTADEYDIKRENTAKWQVEQRVIEAMLSDLPQGSVILDVPCGTGRFFPFYEACGFNVLGCDIEGEMVVKAKKRIEGENLQRERFQLGIGNICSLVALRDGSVDASVMVRMTRWLSPQECDMALRELQRVTRDRIIFTARVRNPNHPHLARTYEMINSWLDGWGIARDEPGYHEDYRIIELRPE